MRGKRRLFYSAATAVGFMLILLNGRSGESMTQLTERVAPDFTLADRFGNPVSLSDFRGQVVLLDFWASWCSPCRQTMPVVQQWHEKYLDEGLMVVGVNIEGSSPRAFKYLDEGNYTFLVLYDKGNWRSHIVRQYGIRGIPQTFLIDRRGVLRFRGHPLHLSETFLKKVLEE